MATGSRLETEHLLARNSHVESKVDNLSLGFTLPPLAAPRTQNYFHSTFISHSFNWVNDLVQKPLLTANKA